MTEETRFEVLGPVRGWHGETECPLGSPQQRAVLVMLLLARGRLVSLDHLIDGLWGERGPRAAAGTVRTYISRLRRGPGHGDGQGHGVPVESAGDGYLLRLEPARLDLGVFEHRLREASSARARGDVAASARILRQALGLWRGPALAGVPGPYAAAGRVPLDELRLAALEEQLTADISLGGHAAAIAELRALLTAEPLRESLTGLLMLALYQSGRQAEALHAFDVVRRRLAEDLGIDPGPALQGMRQRVLRRDRRLLAAVPPGAAGPAGPEGARMVA
jgi:DNA-binding SARP family transcriptional activator